MVAAYVIVKKVTKGPNARFQLTNAKCPVVRHMDVASKAIAIVSAATKDTIAQNVSTTYANKIEYMVNGHCDTHTCAEQKLVTHAMDYTHTACVVDRTKHSVIEFVHTIPIVIYHVAKHSSISLSFRCRSQWL